MLQSQVRPVEYRWVPAARIPDSLRRAVVAAEDQKFWTHRGFDLEAIERALAHNQKSRRKRGASTISQQVAKNLFLWPSRSYLRKALEASFTVLIEALWPKQRILEVYLNIAEFGPGVYGAEAAARKFFGKPAAALTPPESARLAAVLPNPRKYRLSSPGPYVQARAAWILAQIGYRPPTLFYPDDEPLEPLPEQLEAELPPEELLEEPELVIPPEDAEQEAAPVEDEPYEEPYQEPAPIGPEAEPETEGPEAEEQF
jgi:monofunctional biosynthetic peptidoglycan transglycosylase